MIADGLRFMQIRLKGNEEKMDKGDVISPLEDLGDGVEPMQITVQFWPRFWLPLCARFW